MRATHVGKGRRLRAASALAAQATASGVPQLRSIAWVAARLGGVSRVWVFRLHREGVLRGYLLGRNDGKNRGGRLLFLETDILEFLRRHGVPVDAAGGRP